LVWLLYAGERVHRTGLPLCVYALAKSAFVINVTSFIENLKTFVTNGLRLLLNVTSSIENLKTFVTNALRFLINVTSFIENLKAFVTNGLRFLINVTSFIESDRKLHLLVGRRGCSLRRLGHWGGSALPKGFPDL
jgi:hypothetical protein